MTASVGGWRWWRAFPCSPMAGRGANGSPGPDIYYNRARFYDPALGRFLAEDPLGYGGGDSNLYSFAWNNPKNWSDPSGLSATEFGLLSRVTPVAEAAAIGCAISTTLSGLAAWLSGDGTYEVVGLQLASPCIVSPVLARRPGGRGGAGVGSGAGGGRGPGPNDDDDGDPCTPSWESENGYCFVLYPKGSKREEACRRGCLERSRVRDLNLPPDRSMAEQQ